MTSKLIVNSLAADTGVSTITFADQAKMGNAIFHSTGFTIGDSFLHSTGVNITNINATGVITATKFVGEVSVGSSITFEDNEKAYFGTGTDFSIYHNGSASYLDETGTGGLIVKTDTAFQVFNSAGSQPAFTVTPGGVVEIYHGSTKRIETDSLGINVLGRLDVSGTGANDHLNVDSNTTRLRIGGYADLQLYHDSTNINYISNHNDVDLHITSTYGGSPVKTQAKFIHDGAVELYYNNAKTLETTVNALHLFGNTAECNIDFKLSNGNRVGFIGVTNTGRVRINGAAGGAAKEVFLEGNFNGGTKLFYDNSAKLETTNTGAVVTGIMTATSFSGSGENLTRTTQLSHRNIVINGDMRIAQRATSHGSSGYRTIDRFKMTAGGANAALTQAQVDVSSGTSPYVRGFRKAFSITNAGQNANNQGYVYMLYEIEAQDIATSGWRYMYNTSGDDYITVSFWVKASVAQTYLFFIHTDDGTIKEWNHLISLSANAWTKVAISIPGNSGITINNDTGAGLRLYWCAYLGDHYTSGSTVDQWVTHAGYTSRPDAGAGWWTTSNATFQLTGVQLEVGEQATPFEHRSFTEQLARCKRYYNKVYDVEQQSGEKPFLLGTYLNGSELACVVQFPKMRVVPTLDITNGTSKFMIRRSNVSDHFDTLTMRYGTTTTAELYTGSGVSGTQGECGIIRGAATDTYIAFDAEF